MQIRIPQQEISAGLAAFSTIQQQRYLTRQCMITAEFHAVVDSS